GPQADDVTIQIVDFVSNIQVGVLGAVSIAFLFITVITLVQKVETAFNAIWCVSDVRPLGRRVSDYLSVILLGPVLIFTATAAADSIADSYWVEYLSRVEPFGTLLVWLGSLAPLLLWCGAFAVLYGLIPNTRVRIGAALAGGLFAGVLWLLGSALFAAFIAGSSNYSAIYSTFAGAFLFVYWLYVGWLIILVGAQVAYYWQYPEFLDPSDEETRPGHRQAELLGLAIMALVARTHQLQQPAPTSEDLGARLGLSHQILTEMLTRLGRRGLIVPSNDEPSRYYPARDIGAIPLAEVLEVLRRDEREPEKLGPQLTPVVTVMSQLDRAQALALKDQTVRDLVRGEDVRG
ncbi:MAG: YihY/virulence factor BrkB family protein, partial [Candidatus Competibacteraceae bacterium]|nr:YihY/virulence factor BrkB family protein [Candidatus Competibacteraceae bacterium]